MCTKKHKLLHQLYLKDSESPNTATLNMTTKKVLTCKAVHDHEPKILRTSFFASAAALTWWWHDEAPRATCPLLRSCSCLLIPTSSGPSWFHWPTAHINLPPDHHSLQISWICFPPTALHVGWGPQITGNTLWISFWIWWYVIKRGLDSDPDLDPDSLQNADPYSLQNVDQFFVSILPKSHEILMSVGLQKDAKQCCDATKTKLYSLSHCWKAQWVQSCFVISPHCLSSFWRQTNIEISWD